MQCPQCGSDKTRVKYTDSWGSFVRRRRVCASCGYRFWTVEVVQLQPKMPTKTPHLW
ncbi:MAG: hypothetical protein ACLFS5_01890 [Spirochaetaceae bacterium]